MFAERLPVLTIALIAMLLLLSGCSRPGQRGETKQPSQIKPTKIRLLVIDAPGIAEQIEAFWSTHGEGELLVANKTSDDILPNHRRFGADLIVYPSHRLPEFASRRLLAPIAEDAWDSPDMAASDLTVAARRLVFYGKQPYGIPVSAPQWVMLYRQDIFEQHGLTPPTTWAEFGEVSEQLRMLGQPPCVQPLAQHGSGEMLIARAASYLRHRNSLSVLFDMRQMQPQIATEPFVRALDELVAATPDPSKQTLMTNQEVYEAMLDGKASLGICLVPTKVRSDTLANVSLTATKLPGSRQRYNNALRRWQPRKTVHPTRVSLLGSEGYLLSITRECAHKDVAAKLVSVLTTRESASLMGTSLNSAGPYRSSQIKSVESWLPDPTSVTLIDSYRQALEAYEVEDYTAFTIRSPHREPLLDALDQAVRDALSGQEAQSCLNTAKAQWVRILDSADRRSQASVYRQGFEH